MQIDRLWRNARLATMALDRPGLGVVDGGAIAAVGGRIAWCGAEADLPAAFVAREVIDCEGRWITPGLVDAHTHLVYAGSRANEFERRLSGESYADIAAAGGGILATVAATRAATRDELVAQSAPRLHALLSEGVTTIEVKSGYGLDLAAERNQLLAARELERTEQVTIVRTLLAAHVVPKEFTGDSDGYVERVCTETIPTIARERLAESVDAYCEHLAFSVPQVRRLFAAAKAHGLAVRLHADQLSNTGGAALAADCGALSADHLEYTDEAGVAALAAAGTVAVLLPGAFFFLRERQLPPVEALRRHAVPIAVATDCNPGTSPMASLLLAMNMAATCFRLTVEECWLGVTRNAARALGRDTECGVLQRGAWCDLAIWDTASLAEPIYFLGTRSLQRRVWHGLPTS